jgi:thiol-disulfide isomerase/thioredoxin
MNTGYHLTYATQVNKSTRVQQHNAPDTLCVDARTHFSPHSKLVTRIQSLLISISVREMAQLTVVSKRSTPYSNRTNSRKRPLIRSATPSRTINDTVWCTERRTERTPYLMKDRCFITLLMLYVMSIPCTAFRASYFAMKTKKVAFNVYGAPKITTCRAQVPYERKNVHQLSEQQAADSAEGIGTNTSSVLFANQSNLPVKEHSSHLNPLLSQPQHSPQQPTADSILTRPSTNTSTTASFGDVVSIQQPSMIYNSNREPDLVSTTPSSETLTSNKIPSFGDVVPLRKNTSMNTVATTTAVFVPNVVSATISEERQVANQIRFRNTVIAVLSIAVAIGNFVYQYLHPIEPIQILFDLQQSSADISVVGKNHKPTVIDFWAPWCENCKLSAATLQSIENQYGNDVNFILINGDLASSWPYIEALGVDAIPHMSLISYDGVVETALIGPIPKHIIQEDIDVLLLNSRNNAAAIRTMSGDVNPSENTNNPDASKEMNQQQPAEHVDLPHKMLDVFAGKPDSARRVQF